MRGLLAFFLSLLLLWALIAQINHGLAPWHVFLMVDALFVTYAALALPLGTGLAAALAAGFVIDANSPVRFGTHALLFAAATAVLFRWRGRLPHEDALGQVAIALLVNFAFFFALTFLLFRPPPAGLWPRLGADLVLSQVFLGLIAPWFFALQARAAGSFQGMFRG